MQRLHVGGEDIAIDAGQVQAGVLSRLALSRPREFIESLRCRGVVVRLEFAQGTDEDCHSYQTLCPSAISKSRVNRPGPPLSELSNSKMAPRK